MRPPSERLELPDAWGTSRVSRLFPGWWLAHADLHNHTRLSDGAGDPRLAFASMRSAGLDVAALTDHSRWASLFLDRFKAPGWTGIDGRAWRQTIALAEAANADGEFVALHGFEWSHYAQGHMNVWNSRSFTDPLRTAPTMGRFWHWLEEHGDDGLIGFNHPGTGRLRFAGFGYRPALAGRLVSLELFNKLEDYLLKGTDRGEESPLNQCLNAGWRPGLLGVTDEHGADWGRPEGKGRAGLWVRELTRAGVLEALAARRFFASRVKGLRLDAALTSLAGAGAGAGERARMGTAVAHPGGPVRIEVDLDRGEAWQGRRLSLQVLRPGDRLPALAATLEVALAGPGDPVASLELDLDPADGDWVVVRVTDPPPSRPTRGPPALGPPGPGDRLRQPVLVAGASPGGRGSGGVVPGGSA